MNGRTSVLDLARGIGDKNDVGGLLGESAEVLFALAEGVAFSFLQLTEVLLSLEPEKKYQDGGRCQYCGRQQFVSSSQRNTLGPFVLGFNGNLHLVLHQVELGADRLEIGLLGLVKVPKLHQDPLPAGRRDVAVQRWPDPL